MTLKLKFVDLNQAKAQMFGKMTDELIQDLIAIITSGSARLYGQRPAQLKIEKIIAELPGGEKD